MATTNKIQLNVDVAQNRIANSKSFGKWFGKAARQTTLSTRGLAQHIGDHGSIYTIDVVEGVLKKLSKCIPELVGQGVAVKLDGLGTFYPTLKNKKGGADSVAQFNVTEHVKGVRVRFLPDGSSLDNLTSKAFKEKCQLALRFVTTATGQGNSRVVTQTPVSDYLKAISAATPGGADDGE